MSLKVTGKGKLTSLWCKRRGRGNIWFITLHDGTTRLTVEKYLPRVAKITRNFKNSMDIGQIVGFKGAIDDKGNVKALHLHDGSDTPDPLGFKVKGKCYIEGYKIDENNYLSFDIKAPKKKGSLQYLIEAVGKIKDKNKSAIEGVLKKGSFEMQASITKSRFVVEKMK